jgi:hypothetical protein
MTILGRARSRRTRGARAVGVVALALVQASTLNAAAPRLALVSGALLERPVLIQDWDDTMRIMAGINNRASAPSDALTGRPYYELALFWGMEWVQYVNDGRPVTALKPEQANQHARFYPAVGMAPALVVFEN